jgi:hypothetical protein
MHMSFVNQAAVSPAEIANVPGQGTGHQPNGTGLEQIASYLTNKKHVLILIPSLQSPTCCQASPDLTIFAGLSDVSFCFLFFFFLFSQISRAVGERTKGRLGSSLLFRLSTGQTLK